ncbi:IspD/TarI family cytidylyltransferase [Paraclostridium ghonii]|uniref:2-C-methyl-D-erythritol 4-phosphate cytidylyltransferase n=1 Tax=Paraclostridium ghonii TaxID=29358 RepID=A0ABU0MXF4_9FIRM|nr:IspD/TarI family cytidylyltransferase [Paeniclostridium ghonii]MDQ0555186.1 2-C-methyl-D-erythritol 4-phosphate cytidylyltransferase [Paeniclostridium ghonii]
MVSALIFAGGVGVRMNNNAKPKQFLQINGKSILLHTIEKFEQHSQVDNIVVACIEDWIDYLKLELKKHKIRKVKWIVSGGRTGQESILNGLKELEKQLGINENNIVLIHDGVRPIIDSYTITENINSVRKYGSAITVTHEIETIASVNEDGKIDKLIDRSTVKIAKAPQSFYLKDILKAHKKSIEDKKTDFIDSATLMSYYGNKLHTVIGPPDNIKVTTAKDFFMLKAMLELRENLHELERLESYDDGERVYYK